MPELIDRNKLRETICAACSERLQCTDMDNVCFEIACINNAPTIEAEPVRKGWWLNAYILSDGDYKKCSECACCIDPEYFANEYKVRYCPNCGAKMDAEDTRTPTEAALDIADSLMMGGADNG